MLSLRDLTLHYEGTGIAQVRCARCKEALGRIRIYPLTVKGTPVPWEEAAQEELDALEGGHLPACAEVLALA